MDEELEQKLRIHRFLDLQSPRAVMWLLQEERSVYEMMKRKLHKMIRQGSLPLCRTLEILSKTDYFGMEASPENENSYKTHKTAVATLQSFSDDMLHFVFSYLDFEVLLSVIAYCCRRWERITRTPLFYDVQHFHPGVKWFHSLVKSNAFLKFDWILQRFIHLKELKLCDVSLEYTFTVLFALKGLRKLDCTNCINASQAKYLNHLQNLKVLCLNLKREESHLDVLHTRRVSPILPALPLLEELEISGCPHAIIFPSNAPAISKIKKLLVHFHEHFMYSRGTTAAFIEMVSKMTELKTVAFTAHHMSHQNEITALCEIFLQKCPSTAALISLDVETINESVASHLKLCCKSLRYLSAGTVSLGTGNGEEEMKLLVQNIPHVESIYVRGMWRASMSQLKLLKDCATIEHLYIGWLTSGCCRNLTGLRCELSKFAYFRRKGNCGLSLAISRKSSSKEIVHSAKDLFLLEMCSFGNFSVVKNSQSTSRKLWIQFWDNEIPQDYKSVYENEIYAEHKQMH